MAIYYIIMLLLMAMALARPQFNIDKDRLKWPLIMAGTLLTIFVGLRDGVGVDSSGYENLFNIAKASSFWDVVTGAEPVFMLLNWVVQALGFDLWAVNLVCAAVSIGGIVHFVRRQPQPFLGLAIAFPYLIVVFAMSAIRQAAALGIMLFALTAFREGHIRRFIGMMLVASLVHVTSIVALGVALASLARNRWVTLALVPLLAIPLSFMLDASAQSLLVRATSYSDSAGAGLRLAMNLVPAILFLTVAKVRRQEQLSSLPLWRNFAILAVVSMVVLMIGTQVSTAVDRLNIYLAPLQIYVLTRIPGALSTTRLGARLLILTISVGYLIVLFTYFTFGTFAQYYAPYKNLLLSWT